MKGSCLKKTEDLDSIDRCAFERCMASHDIFSEKSKVTAPFSKCNGFHKGSRKEIQRPYEGFRERIEQRMETCCTFVIYIGKKVGVFYGKVSYRVKGNKISDRLLMYRLKMVLYMSECNSRHIARDTMRDMRDKGFIFFNFIKG